MKTYIFAFCILSALIPVLSVDMPRGLAFAGGIIALLFYAIYFLVYKTKPYLSKTTIYLVVIVFALSSLSLLWAEHFDTSLKQVTKLLFLLPPQILVISLALSLSKDELKPAIPLVGYGFALGASLLLFEIYKGGIFFNLIRGASISVNADPDEFNRSSVLMSLYALSAFVFLKTRLSPLLSAIIIFTPLLGALLITHSQTAQLAFLMIPVFLFCFPYKSKWAWNALKAIILTLMLTAPFLVTFIYQNYASSIQDLPMMNRAYAGHRLEIWDYVSRYALQQPLHGFGIEVTRDITDFDSKNIFSKETTALHPHNFVFQIWIEFGLIGIMLATSLMGYLLHTIQHKFSIAQQKVILPTFMATLVPASTAFGMWQGWWLASLFHLAAICLIACKFAKKCNY